MAQRPAPPATGNSKAPLGLAWSPLGGGLLRRRAAELRRCRPY